MKITFNFMYKIFLFDLGLNMKKDKSELLLNSESDEPVLAHRL